MRPMKTYGIVYLITNTVNGKLYVGQTTYSTKRRWQGHQTEAKSDHNSTSPLHFAIRKYGSDSFSVQDLEQCPDKGSLNEAERRWINHYHSTNSNIGYNCTDGDREYDFTPEAKLKISNSVKELWGNPEFRQRVTEAAIKQWGDPRAREIKSKQMRIIMADPARREYLSDLGKQYMLDHPESRNSIGEYTRTTEGRRNLSEARKRYFRGNQNAHADSSKLFRDRFNTREDVQVTTLEALTKARASRQAKRLAARGGSWASEEAAHGFIQGLTARSYSVKRIAYPAMPNIKLFPKLYGKSFKELRDGTQGVRCV